MKKNLRLYVDDYYYYDVIRKNIKKYRCDKKLTQEKLAEGVNLSTDYISEIESVKRAKTFSLITLTRISIYLNKDITKFFDE